MVTDKSKDFQVPRKRNKRPSAGEAPKLRNNSKRCFFFYFFGERNNSAVSSSSLLSFYYLSRLVLPLNNDPGNKREKQTEGKKNCLFVSSKFQAISFPVDNNNKEGRYGEL